jgi:regulator of protease activity HflC (stomatin/prohibitin superfamily)
MSGQWPTEDDRSIHGFSKLVTWLALIFLVLLYWGFAWIMEQNDFLSAPPPLWTSVVGRYPLFEVVQAYILVPLEFIWPSVLRHFIPVLVGAWLARKAVHRFLMTFYGLPSEKDARELLQRLRSWRAPNMPGVTLEVDNFERERTVNPVLQVGGPAMVVVERGCSLITELDSRYARVLGPGTQFLGRFERPFALVDLRPQDRQSNETRMMTKDGIDIKASVGITFQISSNDQTPSHEVTFPFEPKFARMAAYAQTVLADGKIRDWRSTGLASAKSALAEIVSESRLDELAHPMQGGIQPHPSRNREMRRVTRVEMARQGVTVTDTRLGRLELPEAVLEKYLEYWRVYMEKKRRLDEVEGQPPLFEEKEIARARASALMFEAILEGLQRAKRTDPDGLSRRVVAVRLIETLQALARRSQDVSPLPERLMTSLGNMRSQLLDDGKGVESPDEPSLS